MDRALSSISFIDPKPVLLVEADRAVGDLIRDYPGRRQDVRLYQVGEVVSAIRFLAKRDGFSQAPTPVLILLSLNLPYFSGRALLQERRRRPAWQSIPVVVSSSAREDELACLAHGADGFLVRTWDPHDWLDHVHLTMARHLPLVQVPS